ncbi:MAG: adenylate kinase family protein [Candidatus Aenigmarchaeota archaeon]|nr:adenylate kinase family protein [Candidatus Aenigmarchaeota archaeon]
MSIIVAITGTPATGKTSIAKALAKKLGWKLVELNKLAAQKGCFCGYDRQRKVKIVDVEKVKKQVQKLPGNLVIESHYAHDLPNDLTVVLRCSIAELRKRMEKKGWTHEKIEENAQAEIMEICKSEALELNRNVLEIDTTRKNPGDLVGDIEKTIKGITV